MSTKPNDPPILKHKHHTAPSVFMPDNILREARRQKGLNTVPVPDVCVLDPDGDIVRYLVKAGRAEQDRSWACYHSTLYRTHTDVELGIVPCAVGASYAVLVAEQLFASGCQLLLSMTSAGRLSEIRDPPYFVLIEKALRDEGTSYHYQPPAEFSEIEPDLLKALRGPLRKLHLPVEHGATWTTDAPFRETEEAIAAMRGKGLLAVEMEGAALYAFARARNRPVVCFAHVTNDMARSEGDFEKGKADGAIDALELLTRSVLVLRPHLNAG